MNLYHPIIDQHFKRYVSHSNGNILIDKSEEAIRYYLSKTVLKTNDIENLQSQI